MNAISATSLSSLSAAGSKRKSGAARLRRFGGGADVAGARSDQRASSGRLEGVRDPADRPAEREERERGVVRKPGPAHERGQSELDRRACPQAVSERDRL